MAQEQSTVGSRIFGGMKLAIAIFIALPFVLFLLPLWFVHRWHEVRSGRPTPEVPWANRSLSSFFSGSTPSSPASAERTDTKNKAEPPVGLAFPGQSYATSSEREGTQAERENTEAEREHTQHINPHIQTKTQPPPPPRGIAVVTGGAQNLGAAICQDLASIGYQVAVVHHRSKAPAKALVTKIQEQGGVAKRFFLDQSDPDRITQLLNAVEKALGTPDLLINNASLFLPTHLEHSTWDDLERLCRVNLQGPMWLAMRMGERMKHRTSTSDHGGQIIQLCDIWGERPLAGYAAYSVTKAGLIMATRTLAREMAPCVRVNAIAPGAISPNENKEEDINFQKMLSRTPLARHSGPEAVLHAVRYLLTARFVTGEIVHVDGGRSLL